MSKSKEAILALADGSVFRGLAVGVVGETSGEVVFNTSMTGYQEILTDPSYANQLLTFTYPHIGNVGVNKQDVESSKIQVSGLIVKHLSTHYSNCRAEQSLQSYLEEQNVVGISNIDTRQLVLHLRDKGAQMGVVSSEGLSADDLIDKAKALPSMEGQDLASVVSTKNSYRWTQGAWDIKSGYQEFSESQLTSRPHVVALDYGVKYNILRSLLNSGFQVTVVPSSSTAEEVLALKPDGVFLSNGPGDPSAVTQGIETTKGLLGKAPIFGICLGNQILGHALGSPTYKLKFGHRGGNHPVRDERTGKVEITVQNHGFATDLEKIPSSVKVSHINLNDQTVEGIEVPDIKAFSVQHHPECSPGPHDSMYLFDRFYQQVVDGL